MAGIQRTSFHRLCQAGSRVRPNAHFQNARFLSSSPARLNEPITTSGAPSDKLGETYLTLDSPDELLTLAKSFDPAMMSGEIPQSQQQSNVMPPKFFRGPLHPVQPPSRTDPASREFIPGPFSNPRLMQTYHSTVEPDMLTMLYQHNPAGLDTKSPIDQSQRLRRWEGESPYYAGRPLRKPRGGRGLDLVRQPIRSDAVPTLTKVIVHSMVRDALKNKAALDVASMVVQSVTGVRCEVHKSKKNILEWDLKPDMLISVTAELQGESMYHFLSKLFDVVLPRFKDWPGISSKTGDRSGNVAFGLPPAAVSLFPEIESNYDSYPNNMIPGCHIHIHTSAQTDHDARLLLSGMGVPFDGELLRSRV